MLSFSGCGVPDEFSSWKGHGKPPSVQPEGPKGTCTECASPASSASVLTGGLPLFTEDHVACHQIQSIGLFKN